MIRQTIYNRFALEVTDVEKNYKTSNPAADFFNGLATAATHPQPCLHQRQVEEYKVLLNHLREVVFQTDEQGSCSYLNRAWTEITGFEVGESIGRCFLDYVHPADRQRNAALFQPLIDGREDVCRYEVRFTHKGGGFCWVELHAQLTHDADGQAIGVSGTLTDITERKNAEEALRRSQEKLKLALSAAHMGTWEYSVPFSLFLWSEKFAGFLGLPQDLPGCSGDQLLKCVHPADRETLKAALAQPTAENPEFQAEYRVIWPDGTEHWIDMQGRAVIEPGKSIQRLVGVGKDITDRKQSEARLLWTAQHDPLTKLANRTLFMEKLARAVERYKNDPQSHFAVLYVDLDRFKAVNDTLGHAAGDELLIALSRRLEYSVRAEDTVARLGGDEFTVLLEDIKDTNEAYIVVERIRQTLAGTFNLRAGSLNVSASIGVSVSGANQHSVEDFLRAADHEMYLCKEQHRLLLAGD
jgi:diguanylate cyclase (GGDEF)-like protein/PAS domain S-box-containing protein